MGFIRQPHNTGKPRREQDIVPIYLNKKERVWLDILKFHHCISKDSTALKTAAFQHFLIDERISVLKKQGDL